jgi:hypothetical protein
METFAAHNMGLAQAGQPGRLFGAAGTTLHFEKSPIRKVCITFQTLEKFISYEATHQSTIPGMQGISQLITPADNIALAKVSQCGSYFIKRSIINFCMCAIF